jgi:hypothetical protein
MNTASFKLMCRGQGVRTNGCGTYWIGDSGMAVMAAPATHDGSDFERRKRMASEQIGEACYWERAEEENPASFHQL